MKPCVNFGVYTYTITWKKPHFLLGSEYYGLLMFLVEMLKQIHTFITVHQGASMLTDGMPRSILNEENLSKTILENAL